MAKARCEQDILYWINDWCWTYDPRLVEPRKIPFILFPIQEECLLWLQERVANNECGIVEKSRDMGITWLTALLLLHSWIFQPGFKGAIGSEKEVKVDRRGDMDSIFEKIRFAIKNLPTWLLPEGYNPREHDHFLRLLQPKYDGALTGEAGDNIGRGGRNSIYVLDEFAFIEHQQSVEAAVSENANVRLYISTAHGISNMFNQKILAGTTPVFRMHWMKDLRKNYW